MYAFKLSDCGIQTYYRDGCVEKTVQRVIHSVKFLKLIASSTHTSQAMSDVSSYSC